MKSAINKINIIKKVLQNKWFNWKCNTILDTDPLHIVKDRVIIISMLRHSEVIIYLVAINHLSVTFLRAFSLIA